MMKHLTGWLKDVEEGSREAMWTADLSNFPMDPDNRCLAEILFGQDVSCRVKMIFLRRPRLFIAVGSIFHLLGLGSMSQIFMRHMDDGSYEEIPAFNYVWTVAFPICCVWYILLFGVFINGFFLLLLRQFKPWYLPSWELSYFFYCNVHLLLPSSWKHRNSWKVFRSLRIYLRRLFGCYTRPASPLFSQSISPTIYISIRCCSFPSTLLGS